jgi:chromosome segregation ATPase
MDTAAKTAPAARTADRVLDGLATLAALLDRTIHDVKALDSDFQDRLRSTAQDAQTSAQMQAAEDLEVALSDARKTLAELSAEWEQERKRLHAELSKMAQAMAQWEAERARLNGELERLSRIQAATQAEAERAVLAVKVTATDAAKSRSGGVSLNSQAVTTEIGRVQRLIKDISTVIEDPATELTAIIRKNVERAELESYLRGIRFAIQSSKPK